MYKFGKKTNNSFRVIKLKIGIPKGMYIYEDKLLYEEFFKSLGCKIVYSKDTDKEIIEKGVKYSIDEACLASKVFIGHVKDLVDRKEEENIDYIFIPRICSFKGKKKTICVKFFAVFDICKNIFDANFLTLNIDYEKGNTEFKAFFNLGLKITKNYSKIIRAYFEAKNKQKRYDEFKLKRQKNSIKLNKKRPNILLVSHPYIEYDRYLGYPVVKYLEELGANIVYANVNSKIKEYEEITKSIYWKPSINLINGIKEYINDIQGIIYLSVFPCRT